MLFKNIDITKATSSTRERGTSSRAISERRIYHRVVEFVRQVKNTIRPALAHATTAFHHRDGLIVTHQVAESCDVQGVKVERELEWAAHGYQIESNSTPSNLGC